jgi:hypothetical protein
MNEFRKLDAALSDITRAAMENLRARTLVLASRLRTLAASVRASTERMQQSEPTKKDEPADV